VSLGVGFDPEAIKGHEEIVLPFALGGLADEIHRSR